MRFDNPDTAAANFEETWRAVHASPLARDARHVKALELAFTAPLPHWFGMPVSGLEAPFPLSRDALRRALARRPA